MLRLITSKLLHGTFKAAPSYTCRLHSTTSNHLNCTHPRLLDLPFAQQSRMHSAVCSMNQTACSRSFLHRQHGVSALTSLSTSHTRRFSVQMRGSNVQRLPSWQLKAEPGTGGGSIGGGGAGGKKGYSNGDSSSSGDSGGFLGAYNRMLEQNPLFVKAVTTAILSAVGNLICQILIEKKEDIDLRRFSIFTGLGFIWVAPCLHFWYGKLNTLVTATGNTGAIARMACDQLCFAPLFIGSMIAILTALDGKADQIVPELASSLPSAIKANWMLWVPAQFLNFRFIPVNYQVLFSNLVSVAWNVYFSFATRPKTAAA